MNLYEIRRQYRILSKHQDDKNIKLILELINKVEVLCEALQEVSIYTLCPACCDDPIKIARRTLRDHDMDVELNADCEQKSFPTTVDT